MLRGVGSLVGMSGKPGLIGLHVEPDKDYPAGYIKRQLFSRGLKSLPARMTSYQTYQTYPAPAAYPYPLEEAPYYTSVENITLIFRQQPIVGLVAQQGDKSRPPSPTSYTTNILSSSQTD
jgi:hypothetical protein